jgi:hypothetical protein
LRLNKTNVGVRAALAVLVFFSLLAAGIIPAAAAPRRVTLERLRCEYTVNPVGLDIARPRLSWEMRAADSDRGQRQTAYQVLVATTEANLRPGRADLWDSGKVAK